MRPVCVQLNCMRINKLLYLHDHVKSLSGWAVGIIKASRINCLDRQIVWRCKERGSDRPGERERERVDVKGEWKSEKERGRESDEDQGSSRRQHWRTCCSITTQFSNEILPCKIKSRPTIIITLVILLRHFCTTFRLFLSEKTYVCVCVCVTLLNKKLVFTF